MTSSTVHAAGVLLSTKLNAPVGARRRIPRPALVERLRDPVPRRLTLVDAPAGWGKTTLLAEWASDPSEQRRFAWFTVDRSDNDPVRFWAYVVESLRAIDPTIGIASAAALGVAGTDPVEVVLPTLLNELAPLDERTVLVIEDYHLIDNDDIHRGLTFLVERLPPGLELAIATRIDPPLPLARLRSRGELLEIRAAELRFTKDETAQLVNGVIGGELDEQAVELLVGRTEGWAAGLYLAALSLAERDDRGTFIEQFAGDDRHIVDYLGGEVLDGLEEETRDFLLQTSILERVSGPLCDSVTGRSDGTRLLAEIERANLFLVPLDDRREWYRYHHLFSELLRHELTRESEVDVGELHRRASHWLAAQGVVDEAIRHACAAGDEDGAASLVAGQWRGPFNRGELATVDSWLDQLPAAAVSRSPELCIARAWVAMDRGRPQEAERWLAGATSGGSEESTVLHAVLCFKLGKIAHAERIARAARDVVSQENPLGGTVANCILGIALYFQGRLPESLDALAEARALAVAHDNPLAHIYTLGYEALVLLELGDDNGARHAVDEALAMITAPPASEHFVGATARLAHGKIDMDDAALEQALALARRGAAPPEIAAVRLALGELRRDAAVLRAARGDIEDCEDPGRLPELIEAAELALRGRRPGKRRVIAGDLSDRELAVLQLMPTDSTLRDIASALYLSLNTVKTHSRSIYRKLGASNREEAVERGRDLGLLSRPNVRDSGSSTLER